LGEVLKFNPALGSPNGTLLQAFVVLIEIANDDPKAACTDDHLFGEGAKQKISLSQRIWPSRALWIPVGRGDQQRGRFMEVLCQQNSA